MHRDSNKIILVGTFDEAIELAEECGKEIVGLIVPRLEGQLHRYPILGADDDASRLHQQNPDVPAFIGIADPQRRAGLVSHYSQAGFAFAGLIHPQARISRSATLGVGVMVQYGVHLSANVKLGDFVLINTYANVTHDVVVGDYSTIAPNAVILGRVRIGERCYIGAHSTVMPDLEIGAAACVGAQANVTKSVAPATVVVGNPARPQ